MQEALSARTPEREAFYTKISRGHCTPLWEVLDNLVPAEPNSPCEPHLWAWSAVWPWILEAGSLIGAVEAERRVLVLENPGLRGRSRITHSLYAGLQSVLPGETAPAHRHSQSALRVILQGRGAYTTVDGEEVTLSPGDFIVTPSWTFHEHGNRSKEPVVWLDGLDVPLVELLDAQFLERPRDRAQTSTRAGTDTLAVFGNAMRPADYQPRSKASPLCWYPFERTLAALQVMRSSHAQHSCWGYKLQYTNPLTGGWAIPTMAAYMQFLPAGFRGADYRSTDSTVYAVVEGRGWWVVGGERHEFAPKDVFICPSWGKYRLEADTDAVLFSFSDRPVQQALELWREEVGS